MVTFTVTAGLVTLPEDGVIAMVEAFDVGPEPLQPATRMNTIIAPAIPSRVRNRRTEGIINNSAIAIMMKSTCRSSADGGAFRDFGGTMKEAAVMDPLAVAPGAGAALVVGTMHEVISMAGVHVNDTAPVNPPSPVMITGNEPVAPLATVMAAAVTEKSHAGPDSGTVVTVPPVCVIVRVPGTGPGVVVAIGLNVTMTTHAGPPGAITIGNTPALQSVSVNNPGAAAIEAILSGVLPVLVIETLPLLDVVSNAPGSVRLLGVTRMLDVVPEPLPESATSIGWFGPSEPSTMFRVAVSAVATDGVKVTPMEQAAPPASEAVQGAVPSAVPAKSAAFVPVVVGGSVKAMADAVLFVTVTNCSAEAT